MSGDGLFFSFLRIYEQVKGLKEIPLQEWNAEETKDFYKKQQTMSCSECFNAGLAAKPIP